MSTVTERMSHSTIARFLALSLFGCVEGETEGSAEGAEESFAELTSAGEALQVSGHYLTGAATNKPVFLLGDTAWKLFDKGTREDVVSYLDQRKAQGFNSVLASLGSQANVYGDKAFLPRADGKPDVTHIATTSGSNAANATEYDYWDHVVFAIQQADARAMQFILAFGGDEISGDYNGSPAAAYVETPALAYTYGRAIGTRLSAHKSKLTFSIMDDRAPVYGATDKRAHYRALAEGIADGTNGVNSFNGSANYATTFMTALPRKEDPSTANWFHNDAWKLRTSFRQPPPSRQPR